MNKLLLRLVMLFSGTWQNMGADVSQLQAILDVKLKMDDRKPMSFGRHRSQKKEAKNMSLANMFLAFVTGCAYLFPLFALYNKPLLSLWFYFSMFLFMLSFLLITDFSNVLIDTRDKSIIIPRPVNDQTLFLSRILHIFIYLLRLVIPMAIPGWIAITVLQGWQMAVVFPLQLLLIVFIALFLVNGFYLLLLKLAKPEKFKEVINYSQIAVSILLFAAYYILPRTMESATVKNMDISSMRWIQFTPSYWVASFRVWFHNGGEGALPGSQWWSIAALLFPVICMWVTVKWLAPSFVRNIGGLSAGDMPAATSAAQSKGTKTTSNAFYKRLSGWLNKDGAAKAGFAMTWLQTSRSRTFKMKVYPSFAYVPIYFFYLLSNHSESFSDAWHDLPHHNKHLLLLYLSAFSLIQALNYLNISEQYKASWIYAAAPLQQPGRVMGGAFKALWVKFYMPFFLLITAFVLYLWGGSAILDAILALSNLTLFALLLMLVGVRRLPFSVPEQMANVSGRTMRVFLSFFVVGLLGFAHFLTVGIWWLKLIFLTLSMIALWLVWDSYRNTGWETIKREDDY
ncbi:hypothetical protein ACTHGU_03430 [Chitinophagaceae bacterium MMS25-I14]